MNVEENVIETVVIPNVPRTMPNEQLYVYMPIASPTNPGIASYNNTHFVIQNGEVSVRTDVFVLKTALDEIVRTIDLSLTTLSQTTSVHSAKLDEHSAKLAEQDEVLPTLQPKRDVALETTSKVIVEAINELLRLLEKATVIELTKVVSELPEVGEANKFYLVPKVTSEPNNLYDEYLWVNDTWEYQGTKEVTADLSDYVKKTDYLKCDGAPTTATVAPFVGALYLDTTNNNTYQCTAIDKATPSYTWVKLIRETDYARSGKGGVIISSPAFGYGVATNGALLASPLSLSEYKNKSTSSFISKGTLENIKYYYVMEGLTNYVVGEGETSIWTDEDKTKACETIGAVQRQPNNSNGWNRVYGMTSTGEETVYRILNGIQINTIVIRGVNGAVMCGPPSGDNDATNKDYVDNLPDKLTLTDEQKAKWQAFIGLKSETWTFTLADGSTVEKQVIVSDLNTVSGTWFLNETITEIPAQETVNFISNMAAYTSMDKGTQEGFIELYYIFENGTRIGVYTSATGWVNTAYRTVTFDGVQTVSAEFYAWLTANAVKQ